MLLGNWKDPTTGNSSLFKPEVYIAINESTKISSPQFFTLDEVYAFSANLRKQTAKYMTDLKPTNMYRGTKTYETSNYFNPEQVILPGTYLEVHTSNPEYTGRV